MVLKIWKITNGELCEVLKKIKLISINVSEDKYWYTFYLERAHRKEEFSIPKDEVLKYKII